jgi:hypothetical protein
MKERTPLNVTIMPPEDNPGGGFYVNIYREGTDTRVACATGDTAEQAKASAIDLSSKLYKSPDDEHPTI